MGCRANFCLGEVNIFLVLYNTLLPHKLLMKALQSVKYANPQCLCLTRHPKRALARKFALVMGEVLKNTVISD